MNIACLVTTAPRKDCTLTKCVVSLVDAGFKPFVWAEPQSTILDDTNEITYGQWINKKGAWHNWRTSLLAMATSMEHSLKNFDAILTVQDDVIIHPESKRFIEKCLWPSEDTGFISLYCPSHYNLRSGGVKKKPGFFEMQVPTIYGACALLFPRKAVNDLIKTNTFNNWYGLPAQTNPMVELEKRKKDPSLIKHVDAAISRMMIECNRKMWYFTPSLSQHIAVHSALGHAPNTGRRCADPVVEFDSPIDIPLPERVVPCT